MSQQPEKNEPEVKNSFWSDLESWVNSNDTSTVVWNNMCVTGPDKGYFWFTFTVIFLTGIHFLARPIPLMIMLVGKGFYVWGGLFLYLFIIELVSLFKVSLSDPGIVPRVKPPRNMGLYGYPPTYKLIKIKGVPHEIKFCDTCFFYRPPRTIHCGTCNNCVQDFDHHCQWIGNCVGRRNYAEFFIFVTMGIVLIASSLIGNILASVFVIRNVHQTNSLDSSSLEALDGPHFHSILANTADLYFVALILLILIIPVGLLWGMHIWLIFKGITTNEKIKKIAYRRRGQNESFCLWNHRMWGLALCRATPPSSVDGRSGVLYTLKPEEKERLVHRRKMIEEEQEKKGELFIGVMPDDPETNGHGRCFSHH